MFSVSGAARQLRLPAAAAVAAAVVAAVAATPERGTRAAAPPAGVGAWAGAYEPRASAGPRASPEPEAKPTLVSSWEVCPVRRTGIATGTIIGSYRQVD